MKLNKFEQAYAKMIYEQQEPAEKSTRDIADEEKECLKAAGFVFDERKNVWKKELTLKFTNRGDLPASLTLILEIAEMMGHGGWHFDFYLTNPILKEAGQQLSVFSAYPNKPADVRMSLSECVDRALSAASDFGKELTNGLNKLTEGLKA